MTYVLLAALVALVIAWELLVRYQMRRTIGTRFNGVVAGFIPVNTVMTLWRTIYLHDIRQRLTPQQLAHELYHIEHQWAKWPRTFLFRYLLDVARRGYSGSRFENAARRAAGEPER